MIRKTDKFFKRRVRVWAESMRLNTDEVVEIVRAETWWLLFIPVYMRETVIDKPR